MPVSNSHSSTSPPVDIQRQIWSEGDKVTVFSSVAMQAMSIANDSEGSIAEFSELVHQDAKLAADTICLANSAVFGKTKEIVTLRQAVVRLGFERCRNLILAASLGSVIKDFPLEHSWFQELLTQHNFRTASVATHLNHALELGFKGEEFAAGLVHDLGRLLIAVVAKDEFQQADPLTFDENETTLANERLLLKTDHCELGAWYAECIGFPARFVDVIRLHHTPFADCDHIGLVSLIHVADDMANHPQRLETPDGYEANRNILDRMLAHSNSNCNLKTCQTIIPTVMEEALVDTSNA